MKAVNVIHLKVNPTVYSQSIWISSSVIK